MYILETFLKFGACVLVCVCACSATEETSKCHHEWSHLGPTLDLPFLLEEWLFVQNFLHGIHKTFLKFGACVLVCVCAC